MAPFFRLGSFHHKTKINGRQILNHFKKETDEQQQQQQQQSLRALICLLLFVVVLKYFFNGLFRTPSLTLYLCYFLQRPTTLVFHSYFSYAS